MEKVTNLSMALDPADLMRKAGLQPDDWQQRALRSRSRRVLFLCSRQSGKSETAATMALHRALYTPAALVLLVAPTWRQSSLLFNKVSGLNRAIGRPVRSVAETALSVSFANHSKIVSLPGKEGAVRGYSAVNLLVVDEAARVPDELFVAVMPMVATSGGQVLCLSTPHGKRGFFWQLWSEGGPSWERYEVQASECSRVTAEFLAEAKRVLGSFYYSQEFENAWLDPETCVFSTEDIENLFSEELAPWDTLSSLLRGT